MRRNILILMGSPRKEGNTDCLCDAFAQGAAYAGCKTEKICVSDLNLGGCLGCGTCQREGGRCVQEDDMTVVYDKMLTADAIVLASPVYFDTWSGQIKTLLDRTTALEGRMRDKTFYLLSTCQSEDESNVTTMLDCFRKYVNCFARTGCREGGYVFGFCGEEKGSVKETPALEQASELGKRSKG